MIAEKWRISFSQGWTAKLVTQYKIGYPWAHILKNSVYVVPLNNMTQLLDIFSIKYFGGTLVK